MRFLAVALVMLSAQQAYGQCYDQLGRPRVCPNTPYPSQRGVVNLQRNYSSLEGARVREELRDAYPSFQREELRIEFGKFEPPAEIVIGGRVWRRVR